ncbi:hypothetical protein JXL83_04795 [candidate division WOR-3 bacterium]|nr:hypothetical protein [candidate division WOR-3 bacterium]
MKKYSIALIFLLVSTALSAVLPTRTLSVETGYILPHRDSKIGIGDVAVGLYDYTQIGSNSLLDVFLIPNVKIKGGGFIGELPISVSAGAYYWDFLGYSPILSQSTNEVLTDELTGTLTGKLYGYGFFFGASYLISEKLGSIHIGYEIDKVITDIRGIGDFSIDPREYVENTDIYLISPRVWGEVDSWHQTVTAANDFSFGVVKLYTELGYDFQLEKMKWGAGFGINAASNCEIILGVLGPGVEMDDVNTGVVPVVQAIWNFDFREEE